MKQTLRLPRGAALAAEYAPGARSFAIGFWFPLGSRHEAARERGFVHFVEHMTFKGTERRTAVGLSREIDRLGGYINAFTDRDSICLHCLVPAIHWRIAVDILMDMAFYSVFRGEDFEREREVIVSEILAAEDDPDECAHEQLLAAIWPGDPLARKIAGEPDDLAAATRDDLFSFYRGSFEPDALLVTAAGPIPEADIAAEIGSLLAAPSLDARPLARPRQESTPRFSAVREYRKASIGQVNYFEATQVDPPFGFPDYYAFAAVNGIVGEAASSRLFQVLREEQGLCYSVYSAFSLERTECLWLASANASLGSAPRLSSEMGRVLEAVESGPFSEEECRDARERLKGSFELALDDPDFRMRRLARQVLFAAGYLGIDETLDAIKGLDEDAIDAARRRIFSGRARARFAYGKRTPASAAALGLESVDSSSGGDDVRSRS
ncbi:MAG TPA: pitrilysin family protein [Rectinemataceae bacterium]|nr:pitrilysin family protein [Rectinemataceae bacterium]